MGTCPTPSVSASTPRPSSGRRPSGPTRARRPSCRRGHSTPSRWRRPRCVLLRRGDRSHVLGDRCTHRGGALHEGQVVDGLPPVPAARQQVQPGGRRRRAWTGDPPGTGLRGADRGRPGAGPPAGGARPAHQPGRLTPARRRRPPAAGRAALTGGRRGAPASRPPVGRAAATAERVDDHGEQQHRAGDHEPDRRVEVEQGQAVGDRLDHQDAEQRRPRRAAAAEEARAADDRRGDGVQVGVAAAAALVRPRRAGPRRGCRRARRTSSRARTPRCRCGRT